MAALERFGDPEIKYEEEADPHKEFPGQMFTTRSKHAKIDIVARRDNRTVALLTVRWRVRHDRLDVVDEAMAYAPAAHRHNPHSQVYAVLGEFDGGRLRSARSGRPFRAATDTRRPAGKWNPSTPSQPGMVDWRNLQMDMTVRRFGQINARTAQRQYAEYPQQKYRAGTDRQTNHARHGLQVQAA